MSFLAQAFALVWFVWFVWWRIQAAREAREARALALRQLAILAELEEHNGERDLRIRAQGQAPSRSPDVPPEAT